MICSRNGSRALIGKNACITKEYEGLSFGAFTTVFRSKYWKYLSHVFNSSLFRSQSGSYLTTTINQLTISNLNNFIVPFPQVVEQNKITNYLDEKVKIFNKSIKKTKTQIQKLKEAKQSLISEAVTGKIDLRDWEIREVDKV